MSNIYNTKGKVVALTEIVRGTGKDGKEWKRMQIVIDTQEKYNNILAVTVFGDLVVAASTIEKGNSISVEFYVGSKEYNGKYYTEATMKDFAMFGQKVTARPTNEGTRHEAAPMDDELLPF